MIRNLCTVSLLLVSHLLIAQSIEKNVVSSSGGTTVMMSQTIGEAILVKDANLTVISGFQQPSFLQTAVPLDVQEISSLLEVYPNPTVDIVRIKGSPIHSEDAQITVYDQLGKKVNVPIWKETEIQIDFSQETSGTYFLLIQYPKASQVASFKIFKSK